MAATLKTTNYSLPYFGGSDTTDWDAYNESMETIDSIMKENETLSGNNQEGLKNVQDAVSEIQSTVDGYTGRIENLETRADSTTNSIQSINTNLQSQNSRITALENENNSLPAIQTDIVELQSDVAGIKQTNITQQTAIEKNEQDITDATDQISEIDVRVESLENSSFGLNRSNFCLLKNESNNFYLSLTYVTDKNNNIIMANGVLHPFSDYTLPGILTLIRVDGTVPPKLWLNAPFIYKNNKETYYIVLRRGLNDNNTIELTLDAPVSSFALSQQDYPLNFFSRAGDPA